MSRPATAADLQFNLADRLRKSLRVSGISAAEMADYMGAHPNSVSAWINGRTRPTKATLRVWAMKTGVPFEWLTSGVIPADGPDGDTMDDAGASSSTVELRTFNPLPNVCNGSLSRRHAA